MEKQAEREKRRKKEGGANGRFRAKSRMRSEWLRNGRAENTQMGVWRFHGNCSFSGSPRPRPKAELQEHFMRARSEEGRRRVKKQCFGK